MGGSSLDISLRSFLHCGRSFSVAYLDSKSSPATTPCATPSEGSLWGHHACAHHACAQIYTPPGASHDATQEACWRTATSTGGWVWWARASREWRGVSQDDATQGTVLGPFLGPCLSQRTQGSQGAQCLCCCGVIFPPISVTCLPLSAELYLVQFSSGLYFVTQALLFFLFFCCAPLCPPKAVTGIFTHGLNPVSTQ